MPVAPVEGLGNAPSGPELGEPGGAAAELSAGAWAIVTVLPSLGIEANRTRCAKAGVADNVHNTMPNPAQVVADFMTEAPAAERVAPIDPDRRDRPTRRRCWSTMSAWSGQGHFWRAFLGPAKE
jgi:hypothetical protein